MSGPTPEEVRAELQRLRAELDRRLKERDEAKAYFERYRSHSAEISLAAADMALDDAKQAYAVAVEAALS
jgi:hypothetical protein